MKTFPSIRNSNHFELNRYHRLPETVYASMRFCYRKNLDSHLRLNTPKIST